MKKIPTLFVRDPADMSRLLDEVHPDCEWVIAGEGRPTLKIDGVCTMLDDDGKWWARREVKPGRSAPPNYVLEESDPNTGKQVGWEPIDQSSFVKFHQQALQHAKDIDSRTTDGVLTTEVPGTFELVGPKINGNSMGLDEHQLVGHGSVDVDFRYPGYITYDAIKKVVVDMHEKWSGAEGIVWHHPDGRMAKLKARDFPQ